ncbi:MAG: helix-turn-helix transcriptional regulator [Rhodospirillaceae bacterium]|nr:helix-turn-helix transcriptional regulator [Rhodospirillaceae bacterium]MBT4587832.1 helix-turn-helix transcriptional regulator [Rhodospirillaceae bacterium]MBT4939345.1 helix-turn-helix transcriptional regulator [Rhodospirillaceae bacterium]MBT7267682.1 helix-turn-helix transcriptional regulator [Rhodospirillaceae bacterium]
MKTRARILDAARKQLEACKGGEVRMTDIVKTAGISRQAVYLHFPTRAELLIATAQHLDEIENVDARLEPRRTAAKII